MRGEDKRNSSRDKRDSRLRMGQLRPPVGRWGRGDACEARTHAMATGTSATPDSRGDHSGHWWGRMHSENTRTGYRNKRNFEHRRDHSGLRGGPNASR